MSEITIQIVGDFDVNRLVNSLGSHVHFGAQTSVVTTVASQTEDSLEAALFGTQNNTVTPTARIAPVAPRQALGRTVTEGELSEFLYGTPPPPSQHEIDLAIGGRQVMTEDLLDQTLSGRPVLVLDSVDEVVQWIPSNILPGDRVNLQDITGNIVATYVH